MAKISPKAFTALIQGASEARMRAILEAAQQATDVATSLRTQLRSGMRDRELCIQNKGIAEGCRVRFGTTKTSYTVRGINDDGRLILDGIDGYVLPDRVTLIKK